MTNNKDCFITKDVCSISKPENPVGSNFIIYAMFLLSGSASLICEVVWFKQLQLVLGSSVYSVSIIVACFFSGLGFGSLIAGRIAASTSNPLKLYALIEGALAFFSLIISLILSAYDRWYGLVFPWLSLDIQRAFPVTIIICFVLLIFPTLLMGASLPVLVSCITKKDNNLAEKVGTLYALNTLGAAFGSFFAGYILIALFGVLESAYIASGMYVLISLGSLLLVFKQGHQTKALQQKVKFIVSTPSKDLNAFIAFFVIAMSGFISIGYEVIWFRLIVSSSGNSVYVFSAVLSCYLFGLVVGSIIAARILSKKKSKLVEQFASAQLLIPITAVVSLALIGKAYNFYNLLTTTLNLDFISFYTFNLINGNDLLVFIFSFVVLILPTTAIGLVFPLAAEIIAQEFKSINTSVGYVYSVNTIFGVLGSLVTGFILIPMFGIQHSYTILIILGVILYFIIYVAFPNRNFQMLKVGVVACVVIIVMLYILGQDYIRNAQTSITGAKLLAYRESADMTYAVVEWDLPHTGKFQQLRANGTSYANNRPEGRRYMAHLAHLPVLLHPNPKSALCIAIGTGTTIGSLSLHPTLTDVFAVDISSRVFELAPYFTPLNHSFHQSEKVVKVVADGRHFLMLNQRKFDVITLEPPPPTDAGVVNLYSQEFYRLAKSRLTEDGILAQWIPLNIGRVELVKILIKTILVEFEHVSLWMPNANEITVIASRKSLKVGEDSLRSRMDAPSLKLDLISLGFGQPENLLATFLMNQDSIRILVGELPIVTDNHPLVEQFNQYLMSELSYDNFSKYEDPTSLILKSPWSNPNKLGRLLEAERITWHALRGSSLDDKRRCILLTKALSLDPQNHYFDYLLEQIKEERKIDIVNCE